MCTICYSSWGICSPQPSGGGSVCLPGGVCLSRGVCPGSACLVCPGGVHSGGRGCLTDTPRGQNSWHVTPVHASESCNVLVRQLKPEPDLLFAPLSSIVVVVFATKVGSNYNLQSGQRYFTAHRQDIDPEILPNIHFICMKYDELLCVWDPQNVGGCSYSLQWLHLHTWCGEIFIFGANSSRKIELLKS